MAWDQTSSGFPHRWRQVRAVKCRLLLAPEMDRRATWRRVLSADAATFIDRVAQGKHEVTVDVIGENGRRLDNGLSLDGRGKSGRAHDGHGRMTVFGAEPAGWELGRLSRRPHRIQAVLGQGE